MVVEWVMVLRRRLADPVDSVLGGALSVEGSVDGGRAVRDFGGLDGASGVVDQL